MLQKRELTPNWFLQLFGFKAGSISVHKDGVTLKQGEKSYLIDSHSLVRKGEIRRGWMGLGSSIIFYTNQGEIKFGPLPHSKIVDAYEWLQSYWYLGISPDIEKTYGKLRKKLEQRYVRSSQWSIIEAEAKETLSRFVDVPEEGLIPNDKRKPFVHIEYYATMGNKGMEEYRHRYVESKKKEFKKYFENIESYPLTDDQIDACIIDEDNNLVLAGAGTGKTSTMVGRTGFLLESKQANPNDILMLAFGNKAAKEMQGRTQERIGRNDISISTFHKLGKDIIAQVEGASPSISKYAEDDKGYKKDVSKWIDEFLEEKNFKKKVIKYFEDYFFVEKTPFDFESQGEYFSYIEADDIRTFKDEKVKGHGERIIANFLLTMGIQYEYEAKYKHPTKTLKFKQYQPDFYLPEHDVYIEHFGIDKDGSTAPYIDRESYEEEMNWKRQIHNKNETTLIETFYYEHKKGELRKLLEKRLNALEIECEPLPNDAIIETLREQGEITNFSNLMADILKTHKANWFDREQLDRKIKASSCQKHLIIALELLEPIRDRYEKILKDNDDIDFYDMIGKALGYVQEGKFKTSWKYIMVDEFQDISDPRARLVQALKAQRNDCSLFCVGDDWQAIYRFTGSDISFTTGFSDYFGKTKITKLKKTFRFNSSIAEISSKFILQNPLQTEKSITALEKVKSSAVSLLRESSKAVLDKDSELVQLLKGTISQDDRILSFVLGRYTQVNKVLEAINKLSKKASVLILGRYNYSLPSVHEMKLHKKTFPNYELLIDTVHRSKGKEADYVVIIGLQSGREGFPSEKTTDPLLEALLPPSEDFKFAEERRLFYVAMTRARHRTYLVVDMTVASSFVNELIKGEYDIELDEFEISNTQRIALQLSCVECETGIMQRKIRKKDSKPFYGCSHWSLCKHTEDACGKCGEALTRVSEKHDYRVCQFCSNWILVCPECGNDMMCLSGPYGLFWRNKHSHSQNKSDCQYTVSNSKVLPPKGYRNIKETFDGPKASKQSSNKKPNQTQESKTFASYKDACQYAKKLAIEEKRIIDLTEGDGGWVVK